MTPTPIDYESWVQEAYESILNDGDIAIDVGAHVGRHTLPMAQRVFPTGRVFAFEPLPMCRDLLTREIDERHPELASLVAVLPSALGKSAGRAEFVVALDALGYSGLQERQYDWPTRLERISVEVQRLDDLFLGLPSLRYLKLDAEGGELDILRGAEECLLKFRPVVGFEFGANALGSYGITPEDMAQFWSDVGYSILGITGAPLSVEQFLESAQEQRIWDYLAVPVEQADIREKLQHVLSRPRIDWFRVTSFLERAGAHAQVGLELPAFSRFRQPLRGAARLTARLVLYLARIVTGPQREYNGAIVEMAQTLAGDLRRVEKEWAQQRLCLQELERTVQELREEVARLRPNDNPRRGKRSPLVH